MHVKIRFTSSPPTTSLPFPFPTSPIIFSHSSCLDFPNFLLSQPPYILSLHEFYFPKLIPFPFPFLSPSLLCPPPSNLYSSGYFPSLYFTFIVGLKNIFIFGCNLSKSINSLQIATFQISEGTLRMCWPFLYFKKNML